MSDHSSAAAPYQKLSAAIRLIAPAAELARVYPHRKGTVRLFAPDFQLIQVRHQSAYRLAGMIRNYFATAADWRDTHDIHLPTGHLYLTPEPEQQGYVPEDDFTFGMKPYRLVSTHIESSNE